MTNTTNTRAQARTTRSADANGERWTREDLEFVVAFTDTERDEDLAIALGRTLYAIWNIQHRLAHEGVEGVMKRDEVRRTRPAARTYTFIDGDVPDGW